jgi:hypothetical protein
MTIRDADWLEQICTVPEARAALIARWRGGLIDNPNHAPTKAAVAVLENVDRLRALEATTKAVRTSLVKLSDGGHPVVYGVRVEPAWFEEQWEKYLHHWKDLGSAGGELKCRGVDIPPARFVARADYPNGTDCTSSLSHITTWHVIEEML